MPVPLEYCLCLGPCQGSKRSRPRRLVSTRRSQLEYSIALRSLFSLPASYQRPERMEVARSAMLQTAIANWVIGRQTSTKIADRDPIRTCSAAHRDGTSRAVAGFGPYLTQGCSPRPVGCCQFAFCGQHAQLRYPTTSRATWVERLKHHLSSR